MNEVSKNNLDDVIEVYCEFVNSFLPLDRYQFVIYDTPGSNSVMFREHADILKDSLEQQTNGLPIFVTNPDTMDETDNTDILDIIGELGDALDISSMMLVVNKSDEKAKKTLQKKVENRDKLIVMKWKTSRVFFVSSIIGLGGKKKDPKKDIDWIDEDYFSTFIVRMDQFCNPSNQVYLRLFEYNILPIDEKERMRKKIDRLENNQLLIWNSGVPYVEEEIGIFASKYALYNKCSQAIQYLSEAANRVSDDVEKAQKEAERLTDVIQRNLDEKKGELIMKLQRECKESEEKILNEFVEKVTSDSVSKYLDEERIGIIVDDALSSSQGKNNFEKLEPFNKKIEESLKQDIKGYSKEISKKLEEYWKERAAELRNSLMEIVVGSSALNEEEKSVLKKVVLNVPMVSNVHKTLDIKNTTAIKNKGQRFLWIFWDLTKIDKTESKHKYRSALKADISDSNRKLLCDNTKNLQNWITRLIQELTTVMSSFNPELSSLTERMIEQNRVIDIKKKQDEFIILQIVNIQNLISFEEVKNDWY